MWTLWLEVSLSFYDDSAQHRFFFLANPKDFIEVKFDTSTIDNLQGLHSYMNTLLGSNDDI